MGRLTALALTLAALPCLAYGQDDDQKLKLDTSIPEAPGFSIIGVSPTSVIDPAAKRETLLSLANYLDEKGDLRPGVGIGGSPYWWFGGKNLDAYRMASPGERILARTDVSVGYANAEKGKPDQVGVGFSTELLGAADYRLDEELYRCMDGAVGEIAPSQSLLDEWIAAETKRAGDAWDAAATKPHPNRTAYILERVREFTAKQTEAYQNDARLAAYEGWAKECRDKATARYAQRHSLIVAGGWALKSKTEGLDDLESEGGAFWAAYRLPLNVAGVGAPNYLSLFARHDFDRRATVAGAEQQYSKTSLALIFGYEAGASKISAQAGWERTDYAPNGPNTDDQSGFYTVSYDYRIAPNAWLALRAGSRGERSNAPGTKDEYLTVDIRWSPAAP